MTDEERIEGLMTRPSVNSDEGKQIRRRREWERKLIFGDDDD